MPSGDGKNFVQFFARSALKVTYSHKSYNFLLNQSVDHILEKSVRVGYFEKAIF